MILEVKNLKDLLRFGGNHVQAHLMFLFCRRGEYVQLWGIWISKTTLLNILPLDKPTMEM